MKEKLIRIAPILLIIAIAILAITAIVSVGQMIFGGDGGTQTQTSQEKDESIAELLKVESGRSVRMRVRGPIKANEDARSYSVEVSPSSRSLKVFKGYSENVIDQVNLENTTVAYEEFVHALNKANMMKGTSLSGEADDLRGICATGHIYDFAIVKDGQVVKHLWTSTCSGSKGSLVANTKQLQDLFALQIPDFSKKVNDLGVDNLK